MEQELFVVELLLNASHHGVRDRTVVAHAEQLLPLGGEQLACEPQVRDGFGLDRGLEHAVRVAAQVRSEEHTSELQSLTNLVCRLLLEKKKKKNKRHEEQREQHKEPSQLHDRHEN